MTRKWKKQYPGASAHKDCRGKRRWRFREGAFSAELGTDYGSPDFQRRYEAAVQGRRVSVGAGRTIPRSISDLIARYYQSSEFRTLKDSTKRTYRNMLERFREEHGTKSAATMKRRHVKQILAVKSDTPSAANNLRDRLKALMDLAVDLEWRDDNPVIFIKPLKITSRGFHTWTEDEIGKYYATHAAGTLAHTGHDADALYRRCSGGCGEAGLGERFWRTHQVPPYQDRRTSKHFDRPSGAP